MFLVTIFLILNLRYGFNTSIFNKIESIIVSLRGMASDAIVNTQGYTSYLIILFIIILSSNMLGMIPYTLTITSFALTTFSLSLMSFLGLNLIALSLHRSKLADLFLPSGAPLIMS
jgi:F-type H+-transporting ATPase subunit a